ncbi:putative periplasmic protein (YceI-like domain) [Campylobacter pinnipediorum subsp. caledonicus]|uniref:Putative periplasmic protein (YceI-like domain) n=1 Tax=Campylobacter pinnipediorum subsp. caledonicus TaxID=1874362 RepID=A0A1S6U595_9BACT|nr:YceI family protein [Campylobacter pinnipediorum]AQW86948.1 putative periplasmic protein (YceI-like domain) [Campylobacter pinnipediorum subsp. caledonicus]
MKKIISSVVVASLFATGAFAFNAKMDPELSFTGYKMENKTAVGGTFKKFEFKSEKKDSFIDFAKTIDIKIESTGLTTKNPLRDKRIASIFKNEAIMAKIVDVKGDENKGEFTLEITANGVTKTYNAPYEVKDGKLAASAVLDVLDFSLNETFNKFAQECKALHSGKTWSEAKVDMNLMIEK